MINNNSSDDLTDTIINLSLAKKVANFASCVSGNLQVLLDIATLISDVNGKQ